MKHKGLAAFFIKDIKSGLSSKDLAKISRILDRLDSAIVVTDINIPGWNLHELKGIKKGVWSVIINKNWRITFRFENGDALDVNLEDYH